MGNSHSHRSSHRRHHDDTHPTNEPAHRPSRRSLKHARSVPALQSRYSHADSATSVSDEASQWSSAGYPFSEKVPVPPLPHPPPPQYYYPYPYQHVTPPPPPGLYHHHHVPVAVHSAPVPVQAPATSKNGFYQHAHHTGSYIPSPTAGLIFPPPDHHHHRNPSPIPTTTHTHNIDPSPTPKHSQNTAYASFLSAYPEYNLTWTLDALRKSEFSRIDGGGGDGENGRGRERAETYVDYMGGAIYPESLVQVHAEFLKGALLGNTHSESNRSVFVSSFLHLFVFAFFGSEDADVDGERL